MRGAFLPSTRHLCRAPNGRDLLNSKTKRGVQRELYNVRNAILNLNQIFSHIPIGYTANMFKDTKVVLKIIHLFEGFLVCVIHKQSI